MYRLTLTLPPSRSFPMLAEHPPTEAWFEALLSRFRPDVVHVQSGYLLGAPALAAAGRLGIPVVLTLHDYWFACPRVTLRHPNGDICTGAERPSKCAWCLTADKRRYHLLNRLSGGSLDSQKDRSIIWATAVGGSADSVERRQHALHALLDSAALVLAPTRFVATQVAATGYAVDRIRLSRYGMPPARARRGAHGSTLRLAFIGQLAPHKGVHLAIAAVRALLGRDVSLAVHGPLTPYPDYVDSLTTLAGGDPRITFHGPYRREELPDIFDTADVVLVPSLWHEVAAIVIQEAQMAGVPVVASALGGSPELIADDIDGLLFDPRGLEISTRQVARLLDEPGLLPRLQASAPRPRTIEDEVDALLATYADVCQAP